MPTTPDPGIDIRFTIDADAPQGSQSVKELSALIRAELIHSTAAGFTEVPAGRQVSRGLDPITVLSAVATTVEIIAKLPEVVAVLRRIHDRLAALGRTVRIRLAGVDFDPHVRSPEQFVRAVRARIDRPATGLREALIIANSRFHDQRLARLRAPGHDAGELHRVLSDSEIGGFHVETLLDRGEITIRRAIGEFFADRAPEDMLLLHFSGHGIKDSRGRLYLATRDTNLSRLSTTAIAAELIKDEMGTTGSKRVALLLDCCYSGSFSRGGFARSGTEVSMADAFGTGRGHVVLTASGATEYAFEDGEITMDRPRPSYFTQALVSGLETGDADLNSDGAVDIDELYSYVFQAVQRVTTDQVPSKSSVDATGELIIAKSSRRTPLPDAIVHDLASDRPVLRTEAIGALRRLLDGDHNGLRNAARAELLRLRDSDDSYTVRSAATAALGGPEAPPAAPPPTVGPSVSPPEPFTGAPPDQPVGPPAPTVGGPPGHGAVPRAAGGSVVRRFLGFAGRAARPEYWWITGPGYALATVLFVGAIGSSGHPAGPPSWTIWAIWSLISIVPMLAVSRRRLQDVGVDGNWALLQLLPVLGFLVLIPWTARAGDPRANRHGPPVARR